MKSKDITILCKVVDNYGDIGFVYRLARALSECDSSLRLRLIVSDLASFASMASAVDPGKALQEIPAPGVGDCVWQVFDWKAADVCRERFCAEPPEVILECFQCGRPDWLEDLLFGSPAAPAGEKAAGSSPLANGSHQVQILNVEYLTAEDYADDFHCLKSGTRSIYVKKVNFMPGFTPKTGGLVLDRAFMRSLSERALPPAAAQAVFAGSAAGTGRDMASDAGTAAGAPAASKTSAPAAQTSALAVGAPAAGDFYVTVFSYERDFSAVVDALARFQEARRQAASSFRVHALVAAGKGSAPFFQAWNAAGKPFPATALPFMQQQDWDSLLCAASFNLVRGEDSLSRACLAGRPFLWQAYPQEDDYQLVKVQALLSRLKSYLSPELYCPLEKSWISYNKAGNADGEALYSLLMQQEALTAAFQAFSQSLIANGNLAEHLLAYLAGL